MNRDTIGMQKTSAFEMGVISSDDFIKKIAVWLIILVIILG
jgi:hypothetical protein